jgi:hypothetical protein
MRGIESACRPGSAAKSKGGVAPGKVEEGIEEYTEAAPLLDRE